MFFKNCHELSLCQKYIYNNLVAILVVYSSLVCLRNIYRTVYMHSAPLDFRMFYFKDKLSFEMEEEIKRSKTIHSSEFINKQRLMNANRDEVPGVKTTKHFHRSEGNQVE